MGHLSVAWCCCFCASCAEDWSIPRAHTHTLIRGHAVGMVHRCFFRIVKNNLSLCLGSVRCFNVFDKSLFCSPSLHLFAQKYIDIVKYYYNLFLISCNFSRLQGHMILHKSEFEAQETFLIIMNVEKSCACFVDNDSIYFFLTRILWWIVLSK